jgi:hypothetical protein
MAHKAVNVHENGDPAEAFQYPGLLLDGEFPAR